MSRSKKTLSKPRLFVVIAAGLLLIGLGYHYWNTPSASSMPTKLPETSTVHSAGSTKSKSQSTLLASYQPPFANGLVTNEYAFYNPTDPKSKTSTDWHMTSGSLFARDGYFWSGVPDSCEAPNATSSNCSDSDVFRLDTAKKFTGNIKVTLSLKQNTNIHNANCNDGDTCWHGTHIWLRYQNQFNLYYVSVNRADGQVVIKRKVPCGPSDSGTYIVLGNYVPHSFVAGQWNNYTATVQTNAGGSVTIKLYGNLTASGTPLTSGIDHGGTNPAWTKACTVRGHYPSAAYAPIVASGGIGIRGDYANFEFANLTVQRL